ncbi:MAG: TIR domain-containing protein [Agathobacter sp.]
MRYDAFISYRHSELDMYIAKKIHKGLETFKVPRSVAKKTGKKKIQRVFRDQEELPIGSDLGDNISGALQEAEYLLVICSPRTPQSYWVQTEISTFISMHGRERVLAILIEGEPNESFPQQLLVDENGRKVEPLAADVRGTSKKEINKKMKMELLRLAAPILGCSFDDLRQRHRERRMKKIAAIVSSAAVAAAALGITFGAYSAYNAKLIQQNYEGKLENQSKYLADTSLSVLEEGDRRAAVLIALSALPSEENDRPYVAEAQYALSQALNAYDTGNVIGLDGLIRHNLNVKDFAMSDDTTRIISVDSADLVYVWDAEELSLLLTIPVQQDSYGSKQNVVSVGMYEGNAIVCDSNSIRSVDENGELVWKVDMSYVSYCKIDEANGIALVYGGKWADVVDLKDGSITDEITNEIVFSFTSNVAVSMDGSKVALGHLNTGIGTDELGDTHGYVTVYDRETKEKQVIVSDYNYIQDIRFAPDGQMVAVAARAYNYDDFYMEYDMNYSHVEMYRLEDGLCAWANDFKNQASSSVKMNAHTYESEVTGEMESSLIVTGGQTINAFDIYTGELIAEKTASSSVNEVLVAQSSGFCFFGEADGQLEIYNLTKGTSQYGSTYDLGVHISQMKVQRGVVTIRSLADTQLYVYKYHEGKGLKLLEDYGKTISDMYTSPEETYYVVAPNYLSNSVEYLLYKTDSDELLLDWECDTEYYKCQPVFIDDSHFACVQNDGIITFMDLEAGTATEFCAMEDAKNLEVVLSTDNSKVLFCEDNGEHRLVVVDLPGQQILYSTNKEVAYTTSWTFAKDYDHAYAVNSDGGVDMFDLTTGQKETVCDEYQISMLSDQTLAVSEDGSMLAICCMDQTLRILDTTDYTVLHEITFNSYQDCFIRFIENDTRLALQGDDGYFRIFDLENEKFAHISKEKYPTVVDIKRYEEYNTIALDVYDNLLILNAADYGLMEVVENGIAYMPKHETVYVNYYSKLYRFPYMTLEMLLEDAKEQYPFEELSELEKIQYNID